MGISAAAMLASCSNDENLELARNSQVIQFDSFVTKRRGPSTSATTISVSSRCGA